MQDTPAICAVIGRTRHKMVQIELQEAAKRGARLIELRMDFLAKAADFKRLIANRPCPLVATVRRPQDGGDWQGSEEERLAILRQCIISKADYVEIELDAACWKELIRRPIFILHIRTLCRIAAEDLRWKLGQPVRTAANSLRWRKKKIF